MCLLSHLLGKVVIHCTDWRERRAHFTLVELSDCSTFQIPKGAFYKYCGNLIFLSSARLCKAYERVFRDLVLFQGFLQFTSLISPNTIPRQRAKRRMLVHVHRRRQHEPYSFNFHSRWFLPDCHSLFLSPWL